MEFLMAFLFPEWSIRSEEIWTCDTENLPSYGFYHTWSQGAEKTGISAIVLPPLTTQLNTDAAA